MTHGTRGMSRDWMTSFGRDWWKTLSEVFKFPTTIISRHHASTDPNERYRTFIDFNTKRMNPKSIGVWMNLTEIIWWNRGWSWNPASFAKWHFFCNLEPFFLFQTQLSIHQFWIWRWFEWWFDMVGRLSIKLHRGFAWGGHTCEGERCVVGRWELHNPPKTVRDFFKKMRTYLHNLG